MKRMMKMSHYFLIGMFVLHYFSTIVAHAAETSPSILGKVVIYATTSGSSSQYFNDLGITIESSSQTLFKVIPEDNFVEVIDTNYSPSYAKSTIAPYTVDDRFFIRTDWRPYEYGGHHGLTEFNPVTGSQMGSYSVREPNSHASGCNAVVGNTYFYRATSTYDFMYGDLGGEFYAYDLSTTTSGDGTELFSKGNENNCKFNLQSTNGKLYDATVQDDQMEFYQKDTTTGINTELASFTATDADQYTLPVVAFDDNFVYWARVRLSDNQLELWKYDLTTDDSTILPELVYVTTTGTAYSWGMQIDADEGYVAIILDTGILIFDEGTEDATLYPLDFVPYSMQVLYVAQGSSLDDQNETSEQLLDPTQNTSKETDQTISETSSSNVSRGKSSGGGCSMHQTRGRSNSLDLAGFLVVLVPFIYRLRFVKERF